MNVLESIQVALEGIWTNRLRSFLTMLGIIIGVAAVIAVVAIGQGSKSVILSEFEKIGSNLFVIYTRWEEGKPVRTWDDLTVRDAEVIQELVPEVHSMAPISFSRTTVNRGDKSIMAQFYGTTNSYAEIRNLDLSRGRFFTGDDNKAGRGVVVIDSNLAEDLFGRRDPLGQQVMVLNQPMIVIGVVQITDSLIGMNDSRSIYLPINTMQKVFQTRYVHQLEGKAITKDTVDFAMEQGIRILERRHGKDFYQGVTLESDLEMVNTVMGILTLVISSIAGISLCVGGIGVMNIMLVSVTERTREIGLRKALGARRKDILFQFLIESVTICLIGGAIGFLLGIGLAVAIAIIAKWPPVFSWWPVILAIAFSSAVGIFFGLYPANKAAKLDPIDALRYE